MSGLTEANQQWSSQIQGSVFANEITNLKAKALGHPLLQDYQKPLLPMEVHTKTCTLVWRFLGALGETNQKFTQEDTGMSTYKVRNSSNYHR